MENVLDKLLAKTKELPDKTAFVDHSGTRYTTFAQLDKLSSCIAAEILKQGFKKGSVIPVRLPRCMEYFAAEIGIIKAGCMFAPLIPEYPQSRVDYIMKICKAEQCIDMSFVNKSLQNEPLRENAPLKPTDGAFVIFTSGSTGNPKGIYHTQKSFSALVEGQIATVGILQDDIFLDTVPHSFILSLFNYVSLCTGLTVHILNSDERKDIRFTENYIADRKITVAVVPPSQQKVFNNKSDSLRLVLSSGERLSDRFSGDYRIFNAYGSSETGGVFGFFVDKKYDNTPIGKPVPGVSAYILDKDGNPVPDGEEGELCLSGPNLSNGYLDLPEQTAKVFVPNPFSISDDDKILFHTNDIVKKAPDGNFIYLNRADWMVKINGQRVEIGETEIQIAQIDGINEAAVKAFDNEYGQTYLVGYYKSDEGVTPETVRNALEQRLPDYMIPTFFVQLDALPRNVHGKIDRKALNAPDASRFKSTYKAPETETEKKLCVAFEKILACGKVGVNDDFFALGGDSVKVMKLQTMCDAPGLSTSIIFEEKTPAKIAAALKNAKDDTFARYKTSEREYYPLTQSQMGVYLACVQNPNGTMYNNPVTYAFDKDAGIDVKKLTEAVKKAVKNHAALAVVFDNNDGTPCMKPVPEFSFDIPILKPDNPEQAIKDFVRPFDLANGPLFRFAIFETESRYYLAMDFHHLVFDGTSASVICREITLAYNGEDIPPEQLTQLDLALYEENLENTASYADAKAYYESIFADVDIKSEITADTKENSAVQNKPVSEFTIFTDGSLSAANVENFTREIGITPNTLFLGAFEYAISKFTGQNETLICTVEHGRHDARLYNTVGMMVRTLPLYTNIDEESTVANFLSSVQTGLSDTIKHDIYPFVKLSSDYDISPDIIFAYQSDAFNSFNLSGVTLNMSPIPVESALAKLDVMIFKTNGGFELRLRFRTDLYCEKTIRSFADMYIKLIKEFMTKTKLCTAELLTDKQTEILDEFNRTAADYDETETVVDMFREQVRKTPDNTAIVYLDKRYTYAELDEITDRLAGYLRKQKIGREDVVSVLIPRCEYIAIASIGVLKAGAAYQPLDPTYPAQRLNFMTKDANAKLLIADESLLHIADEYNGPVLLTKDIPSLPACEKITESPRPEDLFILLYTSGSTGVPKGTMLEHRNIISLCHAHAKAYEINEQSRAAAYASYGFDANIMEMYPALTVGASLHIIDETIRLNLSEVNEYFETNGITHSFMTTQVGRQFASEIDNHSLKYLLTGGEKLVPVEPPKNFKFVNLYGPTEATVYVAAHIVDKLYDRVPIGKAVDNTRLYVTDKYGRRLPVGALGELCIAGSRVSRGYLNRPEQTEKVYTANPFEKEQIYERMYHTGDIVRFMPDGKIDFIGRNDGQVKIRGFRIELSEVERVIRKFDGIKDATVTAYDDPAGGKYIAAYIVSDKKIAIDELNDFIVSQKPSYMVPAATVQIDKIPMTQNQKVNKRALPVPERKFEDIQPPENENQQKIFDIVSEILGTDKFGINTSIYSAGLTSLGAVRLNVMLAKTFGKAVQTHNLKENETVKKLELFLCESDCDTSATKITVKDDYPLTKNQEGIFVECTAHPDSTVYNIPILLEISDDIDTRKLARSIVDTVNAHPYIKTHLFINDSGDIRQKRADDEPFTLEDVEIIETEKFDTSSPDIFKPFKLLGSRLIRFKIIKADKKYLFIEIHHIIADGTSLAILLNDISKAYSGDTLEKEVFGGFEASDFELSQRQTQRYDEAVKFYDTVYGGCDADCLPTGDLKEPVPKAEEIEHTGIYAASKDVQAFCKANKLTLNGFFTAVFGFVLSEFSGKEESVFTTIYNGRNDSRLADSVAMLVKTLPVKCDVSETRADCSVVDYVSEICTLLMDSMSNDIFSFAEISRKFNINADVMFAYQGESFNFDTMCSKPAKLIKPKLDNVKAPLNMNVFIRDGKIHYSLEYRADRFSRKYALAFTDAVDTAVSEFIGKKTLKQISVLSDKAKEKIGAYNNTEFETDGLLAPQMFKKQALSQPHKTAVTCANESLTFAQLNSRANKIANALIENGVTAEDTVTVYMNRCVDVYAMRQGIMKSGAAFLSTDPEYPDERISYIAKNADSEFVLTTAALYEKRRALFDSLETRVLLTEDIYRNSSDSEPDVAIRPDNLAYCIFTSGSTGKPKGVMIEHGNLANMLAYGEKNILAKAYVDNTDVFLALAAMTFDVSVIEEMMPLCHGKSVAMATEDEIHNPILLAQMMKNNGVDMMKCTPSYMLTMLDFPQCREIISQLNAIIIGAEPFPEGLYEKIRATGFKGKIFNSYGPTETTVTVTIDELDGKNITIGKPAGNTAVFAVDRFGNILPEFAKGELVISGKSVGRGYIKLQKQTDEKFIKINGKKAYLSGDIAYFNGDGKIIHCGRNDNQIKLRGLRIELDEIENTMNRFEGIKRSVVLVKGDGDDKYLCGYYVCEKPIDTEKLIAFMSKTLTAYMIPTVFVHISTIPMTPNGKIDKKALPEPEISTVEKTGKEPQNDTEKRFCDMFETVLGLSKVYADDDFFALGGTSLSASKIAMKCLTEHINVSYADVFTYATPEKLALYVSENNASNTREAAPRNTSADTRHETLYNVLEYNTPEHLGNIRHENIGNVLVTGATGFLGIHIVRELLAYGCEKIYCLVRKGNMKSVDVRLKMMFMYYFNDTFENEIGTKIIPIEGDITEKTLSQKLEKCDFDTVINCAASVKHFASDDLLDRVNVQGVKNLIDICTQYGKKLVQVSTVSIAGESVDGHIPDNVKLKENMLDFGQVLDNKYTASKFAAENAVLEAISNGLRGKIMRVGNLMSREKDGEFQINYSTNGFMNRLRAYSMIGCYPVESLDSEVEFSSIDFTAKAIVKLAGTPDKFTVFHPYNCHCVHMANVLEIMNKSGIQIDIVENRIFRERFNELLADDSKNMEISSLIAYMNSAKENRRYIDKENAFTVKALYRLGFSWHLTDESYIRRAVDALATLGFFDASDESAR